MIVIHRPAARRLHLRRIYKPYFHDWHMPTPHWYRDKQGELIHHHDCFCWICYYRNRKESFVGGINSYQPPKYETQKRTKFDEIQFFK